MNTVDNKKSPQTSVVEKLVETLEGIRTLTEDLWKSAHDLDGTTVMDRLEKRKALIVKADELRQELQRMSISDNDRTALWRRIETILQTIQHADESFVAIVREKKQEVGNILSSLYRQQNQGQYYHGGYHGNQ